MARLADFGTLLDRCLSTHERLQEAEYFALRMFEIADSAVLGYELNAFLSSARSVTFLLQKEYASTVGFREWWQRDRVTLANDVAARFLLELRNFSQKQGPVSIVGSRDGAGKWRFMFAGTAEPVPAVLLNRDVADCCLEHLAKLACAVLRFASAFPFHCCPARALTPEGMAALCLDPSEVERALGFPPEFSAARPVGTIDDFTRLYRSYVDAVDFDEIQRIANYVPKPSMQPDDDFGLALGLSMVENIENSRASGMSHDDVARLAVISQALKIGPGS